jgi:serine/arginine repetitive matrix protein 2
MYNGIGLETVRGSGTNGYVQRNLSALRRHKDTVDYKSENELQKLDAQMNRGPNQEILDHERKRKVELKCMEMQELMEEQGYGADEIDKKVSVFRQMLMEKSQSSDTTTIETDDAGRPIAKATHQIAEANQMRNDQLKSAFGIGEFYKEGSSFDKERKAKENAAKTLAMAQAKYTFVPHESSSSSSESEPEKEVPKRKKKRSSSSSAEPETKRKHKSHKSSKTEASTRSEKSSKSIQPITDEKSSRPNRHNRDEKESHSVKSNTEERVSKHLRQNTDEHRSKSDRHSQRERSVEKEQEKRKKHKCDR